MFKNIFKVISGLTLITTAIANFTGDCHEIEKFDPNIFDYIGSFGDGCTVNEDNTLKSILFHNSNIPLNILEKIFSYKTLESIRISAPLTDEFKEAIRSSPNIKEIFFSDFYEKDYDDLTDIMENVDSMIFRNYDGTFPKSIYSLKNLKKLKFYVGDFTQTDIDEMSKMPGLEELSFNDGNVNELNLEPLINSNITKLSLIRVFKNIPSLVYSMKNMTKFEFESAECLDSIPDSLFELKDLTQLGLEEICVDKIPEKISNLKSLEELRVNSNDNYNIKIPKQIADLSNLKKLDLEHNYYDEIPKEIFGLKNLEYLSLAQNFGITTIPKEIVQLKKLKYLYMNANRITTIPDYLAELENLEQLYLNDNKIDSNIPQALSNLEKLKEIDLGGNINVKGDMLTNESLEYCIYGKGYDVCKVTKSMKCLEEYDENYASYHLCSENGSMDDKHNPKEKKIPDDNSDSEEDIPEDNNDSDEEIAEDIDKISTNSRCGSSYGKCPKGECCSKYGWCGTSKGHCAVTNGCQSKFGKCDSSLIYIDGKCGGVYGKCPKGLCCSKYGWCGKSSGYCGRGCQSEFGKCN